VRLPRVDPSLLPEEVAIILDSVADGVFTVDDEFRITSFNHAAEEITGVPVTRRSVKRAARSSAPPSVKYSAP